MSINSDFFDIKPIGLEQQPNKELTKLEMDKMEENKFSVENIIAVVTFAGKMGIAIKECLADDGKISGLEYFKFVPVLTKVPTLIGAIPHIPEEITDPITPGELIQLETTIKELGCLNENTTNAVTDGLKLAVDIRNYIYKYFVNK